MQSVFIIAFCPTPQHVDWFSIRTETFLLLLLLFVPLKNFRKGWGNITQRCFQDNKASNGYYQDTRVLDKTIKNSIIHADLFIQEDIMIVCHTEINERKLSP